MITLKLGTQMELIILFLTVLTTVTNAEIIFVAKQGSSEDIMTINEAKTIRNISRHEARDLEGTLSIDGAIAFMSARSSSFDIFVSDRNGGNLQNLTRSSEYESSPLFSPDGKWITFRAQTDKGKEWKLKVMKRDGSGVRTLGVADDILDVSWSPDSKMVVYAAMKGTDSFLFIVDRETLTQEIVRASINSELHSEAFQKPISIRVQITACKWSPNAKWIAYVRHPEIGANQQLRIVDPKSKEDRLVVEQKYAPQDPVWSKDSKRILFASATVFNFVIDKMSGKQSFEGEVHIFISELSGKTRQITTGKGLHRRPVWSPNEHMIAFLYEDSLSSETSLRLMDMSGAVMKVLHENVFYRTPLQWVGE